MMYSPDQLSCPECRHTNPDKALECELCGALLMGEGMTLTYQPGSNDAATIKRTDNSAWDPALAEATIAPPGTENDIATAPPTDGMAHFKIEKAIGQGGMGAIYQAEDLTLHRNVALKLFRRQQSATVGSEGQLLSEARMACKLNHPNIVTIYDIARGQDNNFIVMEWVDGKPLSELIPDNGLPVEQALEYACQIADALACAHQSGIIHRDIKPQNIMLNKDNLIKVLDFGIAVLLSQSEQDLSSNRTSSGIVDPEKTRIGGFAGTPQYMAPEQALGKPVDARADIFSFGIVLFKMLTGKRPFKGQSFVQLKESLLNGNHTSLKELRPDAPGELGEIVDKMLLTDVTQRWQSASEVADALRAVHQELTSHKNWWQRQHWASKVAMMLPFILLIGFSAKEIIFPPSTEELIQRQVTEARKIAVLPFENISGDPLLQIFNDGLVATLNRDLTLAGRAQGDGSTWVVPAGEIRRMDNPGVQQVADKYGVDIVLTGSIQHLGSTRHLVMDLIDARDGLVLKSTELNIDAKQLFDGQNSVRQAVIELLDWSIPESLAQQFNATRPTLDGAYREYLSGMGYMYRTDQTRGLENAINAFRNALAIEPGYQNAYEGLATAQIYSYLWTENSEWLDKAADTLSKLTELNADHTGISFLSAELARHKGEYQQSLPLYLLSIEKSPQHAASYSGLAKTYEQLGDFEKALITYQNAIQRFPYNGILHVNLGNLHFRKGDYAKALAQYQRLAKLSPNNSMAYMNAAAAYYSLGDIDNAITYTRKSLDIKEDGDTYSNLGTMLFYIERYDQAVVAYEKAVSFGDKSHHLWGNLADAYKMTNNDKQSAAYQQAMVLAEEALQLNPKNITAAANIAYYLANLGDRERAINYVESLGRNINGINHFFVALTYDQLGMIDESLAHLELAINKNFPVEEIINSPLLPASRSDARFSQLGNDLLKRQ